jgi:SAM-dependent methyltransferase
MHELYDDADLYDLVAPRDPDMERFYVKAAGGFGRRVLELACGSGCFTLPLIASGAEVTAIDLAPSMLARAGERLAAQGHSARLIQADMRAFHLGETFDAVVIAANSLMHLHSHDDFTRAFSAIHDHLKADGVLVFDIFVPSARLLSLPPGQRELLGTFIHPQLGGVTVEETIAYDPISQISQADWYWSTGTHADFRHTRLDLRQIYLQELPLLLNLGGLVLTERFGGFDRAALDGNSFRQVCIARRA